MGNRIVLAMNLYNDIMALTHCLPTIVPYIDEAIIVDGAYKDYPSESDYSDDGSVEYIKHCLDNAGKGWVVLRYHDRLTEVQKRTRYYEYVDDNMDWKATWLLIWDADWELAPKEHQTWDDVKKDFDWLRSLGDDVQLSRMYVDNGFGRDPLPGVGGGRGGITNGFHNTPDLEVKNNHFSIYEKATGRSIGAVYPCVTLHRSRIINRFQLKSQERIDQRSQYLSEIVRKYEV